MIFFEGAIGQLVRADGPMAEASIRFFGLDPTAPLAGVEDRVIVSRVTLAQSEDIQTTRVGRDLYLYAFGAQPGTMSISGLAFSGACSDTGPAQPFHGAGRFASWYRRNRVGRRKTPIELTVAGEIYQGFLTKMTADTVDPSNFTVQIGADFLVLPED